MYGLSLPTFSLVSQPLKVKNLQKELVLFANGKFLSVSSEDDKGMYCRTRKLNVPIFCLCKSPWIEGTTFKAIYRTIEKELDAHVCAKCGDWFH